MNRAGRIAEIKFQPGIITELSPLQVGNREGPRTSFWLLGDKVRFVFGQPEQIGGWENTSIPQYYKALRGRVSKILDTQNLGLHKKLLLGTHLGLYGSDTAQFAFVSPITNVTVMTNKLATSAGSNRVRIYVTVSDLSKPFSHYPLITKNTQVAFISAFTTIGGNILLCADSSTTSQPYMIVDVTTNFFEIETTTTAQTTEVSVGGTFTHIVYFFAGSSADSLTGWSTNVWSGPFPWSGSPLTSRFERARIWSLDWWGTDIVAACHSPLIYWDAQDGPAVHTRAVFVTAAPSIIDIVRVHPVARYICAYGTHTIPAPVSTQYDPLYIRWASQESYTDWIPTVTNTAGDFRLLSDGSEIMAVERVGEQFLILTDKDAFIQQFIGGNDVFSFQKVGTNCGALSKNSMVVANNKAFWISKNKFFIYDGKIETLPCTVTRYIFDDFDYRQQSKVFGSSIAQFNEIIWFYPSIEDAVDNIGETTRYVIYNFVEKHWTIGRLLRTAWHDQTVFGYPIAAGTKDGGIFFHEKGTTANGQPINSWIESGALVVGEGDPIVFSDKAIVEITKPNGQTFDGEVDFYLIYRKYPNFEEILKGPYPVSVSSSRISTRLRGRDFRVYLENDSSLKPWRLGSIRMNLMLDGKR